MLSSEDLRCAVPKATKLKARHILQAGDTKKQQKSSFSVFERVFTVRFSRVIAQDDRTSLLNPATPQAVQDQATVRTVKFGSISRIDIYQHHRHISSTYTEQKSGHQLKVVRYS